MGASGNGRECLKVAKVLEVELAKLEHDHQGDDELVGDVRPRRRMLHPRSELQIFAALDGLCKVATRKLGGDYTAPCQRIIGEHRDALENGIYADGLEHVRHLLCMDLVHACGAHSLYDAGEL
ncbi:hypothetical protein WJX75_009499 [Coccomyxa subellipsoidea]|uniref:Uncharacterized protein n=1 Tax=Coccomyxa subellipsoidea TaxID=248742 RepID=A0ABR2YJZ4_9CHLO